MVRRILRRINNGCSALSRSYNWNNVIIMLKGDNRYIGFRGSGLAQGWRGVRRAPQPGQNRAWPVRSFKQWPQSGQKLMGGGGTAGRVLGPGTSPGRAVGTGAGAVSVGAEASSSHVRMGTVGGLVGRVSLWHCGPTAFKLCLS